MFSPYEIIEAIRANDLESIKQLIQQGVELNSIYDVPPLAEAARLGKSEIMRLLIESGADVNLQMEEDGETALMEATLAGHLDAVKILVEAGADVNAKNIYQEHALSMAAHKAHEEIFGYLDPLTIPKWEPGARILAEAKRRNKIRNVKGLWVDLSEG